MPNDDYVAKVGAAAGSSGLPDLFAADIVYVPELGQAGPVPGPHGADRRPVVQGRDQQGPPDGRHRWTARSTCCRSCSTCRCCSGTRTCSRRPGLDPEKAPATLAEFAADAKAIQALNKPGVYGTATGLNCGGCLVFTWFPSVWARGDQVMNAGRHRVAARPATPPRRSTRPGRTCGSPAPCCRRRRTRPARPGPPASPQGKVGLMFYPATLLSSTTGFDVGVAGIPGRRAAAPRRSSAATASASRRTPRRPPRRGTS